MQSTFTDCRFGNKERGRQGFIDLYLRRLFPGEEYSVLREACLAPSEELLRTLIQRHLEHIPFENLSLHCATKNTTAVGGPPTIQLDEESLIQKLLIENRGGCCLELNGLFAKLLCALGYEPVRLLGCFVAAGPERGHQNSKQRKFRTQQTHFVLYVNDRFLVDVGLGEPPMGPITYVIGMQQTTVEGLTHRIVRDTRVWKDGKSGKERHCHILEWLKDGEWESRLQWDTMDLRGSSRSLESFNYVVGILEHPSSTFKQKIVVSVLTPREKRTLTGRVFKVTNRSTGEVFMSEPLNDKELQQKLTTIYRLPVIEGLDLATSDSSPHSRLWEHL